MFYVELNDKMNDEKKMQIDDERKKVLQDQGGWQLYNSLTESCDYMYSHKVACDVNFIVQYGNDTQELLAHKFILISRSPVFEAMFCGPFDTDKVEVKDCHPVAFEQMLR